MDVINNKKNLNDDKKKEDLIEKLKPVTRFYKNNFVAEEKFNEFFHVPILMFNQMPETDGAKLYSYWMRMASEESKKKGLAKP
jgi:hypothetical protein